MRARAARQAEAAADDAARERARAEAAAERAPAKKRSADAPRSGERRLRSRPPGRRKAEAEREAERRRRGRRSGSARPPRGAEPDEPAARPRRALIERGRTCRSRPPIRALRDVRAALADVPPLPSRRDYDEIVQRLKAAQAALAAASAGSCARSPSGSSWANIGIQEQLCEKMEALRALERRRGRRAAHPRAAAAVASGRRRAARAQGEALWRRFKAVHDELWARCEAHFAAPGGGARRESREERPRSANAPKRSPSPPTGCRRPRTSRRCRPSGRPSGPVTRGQEKADLGSVPRRLRSLLHQAPGRPRQAKDDLGRELRQEGSALSRRRGADRFERLGDGRRRRFAGFRPNGRRLDR